MHNLVSLILFFISLTTPYLAQETNVKENIISFNGGGTSTTFGISYNRIINEKLSLELGAGMLGVGLGINFYSFKPIKRKQFNPFWGIRSSFNLQGSGGSRIINYSPFGVSCFTKKICFEIDLGPAYIIQLAPNGKQIHPNGDNYPEYTPSIYGGCKFGLLF